MKILQPNMDSIHIIAYVMEIICLCDSRAMQDPTAWNTYFYHQYLQQHARMTQWIQNLHQNIHHSWQNFSNHGNLSFCHHQPNQQLPGPQQGYHIPQQGYYFPQQGHHVPLQGYPFSQQGHPTPQQGHPIPQHVQPISQQGHHVPQQGHHVPQKGYNVQHQKHRSRHQGNYRRNSHYDIHHKNRSQSSIEYDEDVEIYQDEEDNDNGSDGELVLNVDAILAFRAEKEESVKDEDVKSEESFELVDTILDENFEFVELDDAGQLNKIYGRPTAPDAKGDVEYDREARIVLYGDRADRIAGLETSLEIMFDHFNDLHQPVVFPRV